MPDQSFPEPTAGALIFNEDGKVFLMKSHKWKDKFVMPGGHVELGETIEEALVREVKEETGLDIYDVRFLCFFEFIYDDAFWKRKHMIFFDFVCKTKSKKVVLDSEGQEFVWADMSDMQKLPIEPYTRRALEEFKKRQVAKK